MAQHAGVKLDDPTNAEDSPKRSLCTKMRFNSWNSS